MERKKIYCVYCGGPLISKMEGDEERDYCPECKVFFYDNPLPVVSVIVVRNRELMLVKRKNEPRSGFWCLPTGFAETGESIESAALRELREESGIKAEITRFVNVESGVSEMYGDLLFITFEAEWTGGKPKAGDDASEVRLFPINQLPELAFTSNINAIKAYISEKQEYWTILDSFSKMISRKRDESPGIDFLANKLIRFVEKNTAIIAKRWLEDVRTNHTTPTYSGFDPDASFLRNKNVILHFRKWLEGKFSNKEIRKYYQNLGAERKSEGFSLSEVLSALSLTKKHIWEFALTHGMWDRTIDIYMTLELERHMMLFFDKASYHISVGYEN